MLHVTILFVKYFGYWIVLGEEHGNGKRQPLSLSDVKPASPGLFQIVIENILKYSFHHDVASPAVAID